MKKLLLLPAVALMMASCGGVDVCSCKKTGEDMMAEMKDAKDDDARKAIEEKYKEDAEACKKMSEEMMEGLEGEELQKKSEELMKEMEACK